MIVLKQQRPRPRRRLAKNRHKAQRTAADRVVWVSECGEYQVVKRKRLNHLDRRLRFAPERRDRFGWRLIAERVSDRMRAIALCKMHKRQMDEPIPTDFRTLAAGGLR